MRIQCISTMCGFYSELQLGKWYDGEVYMGRRSRRTGTYGTPLYLIKGIKPSSSNTSCGGGSDWATFPQSLFRTIDERRDNRLNKILK